MTKNAALERIENTARRIFAPQTDTDRELFWTAIAMFLLGVIVAG